MGVTRRILFTALWLLFCSFSFSLPAYAQEAEKTAIVADALSQAVDPTTDIEFSAPATLPQQRHAIALHGEPEYPANFSHFNFVNPNAPKGGTLRQDSMGSFDSLNPFIVKGSAAAGIGHLFDTLTYQSPDEAFTQYGLLAKSIELASDNSWVRFYLREEARFHDGTPVLAEDVVFSFNILKHKGSPFYKTYYAGVKSVKAVEPRVVQFDFVTTTNRELPLIVGALPVFPQHFWQDKDFARANLEIPVGSGPYKVKKIDAGRAIHYQRDPNYWGEHLAVNKGRHNIDTLIYEYYRDSSVALEAFKSGRIDYRLETSSKDWATAYESRALTQGRFIKEEVKNANPQGMQAFVVNTRKPKFADPRLRQALTVLFDFEWTNQNLFYGAYTRSNSYFSGSELAASSLPDKQELALLEPFRTQVPTEVFTQLYQAPKTAGDGNIRPQMRQAVALLQQAGWQLKKGKMVNANGEQLHMEFMLFQKTFERVVLPYTRNLAKVGIATTIRLVDISQYINRLNSFDFDVVVGSFGQSASPGNEQLEYWGSESASRPGSRNWIGVKNPVVDALIDHIIHAPDRQALVTATRALDRVLLWHHYVIPHWHLDQWRIAYWEKVQRPKTMAKFGLALDSWWVDNRQSALLQPQQTTELAAEQQERTQ